MEEGKKLLVRKKGQAAASSGCSFQSLSVGEKETLRQKMKDLSLEEEKVACLTLSKIEESWEGQQTKWFTMRWKDKKEF